MRPRIEVVAFVLTADRRRGIALVKVDGAFVEHLSVERGGDGRLCVEPLGPIEGWNRTYECREREDRLRFADLAHETRVRVANVVVERAEEVR